MQLAGARSLWRIAVAAAAVFAVIASVRDWSVRAPRSHPLAAAAQFWAGHPKVAIDRLMIQSALAARSGRSLDTEARSEILKVAKRAPLAPDAYLVAGALAQLDGDMARAERLYLAARLRNPRAPAARLLLADLELRNGKIEQGLANLVAIVRISPRMGAPVVPGLAQYARSPGAIANMRAAFAHNPTLADAVLNELASDPDNASLVLELAPRSAGPALAVPGWGQRLIDATYVAGRVAQARGYWTRFNRIPPGAGGLVFNPAFARHPASPPFNWSYFSGSAGMVEPSHGGGLSIVHFGREPALLARQLLALEPGAYAVRSEFSASPEPGRLEWRIQCLDGSPPQVLPADSQDRMFRIGPGCVGAWLDLYGLPTETESRLDAVLRRIELKKVG